MFFPKILQFLLLRMVVCNGQNVSLIGMIFIKYVKKHIFGIEEKNAPIFGIGANWGYGNVLVNLNIVG